MRVVLDVSAVPARPVGAGVATIALASVLARRAAVELHLATRRDDAQRWPGLVPGAAVHPVAPATRPLRIAWEQVAGARLARRVGADVWHGPHYTMPRGLPVPAVVTVHDLTFYDHPEWHERTKVLFFRRMIARSAAEAAVLVCDSEFTASRLRANVPAAGDVVVIHLGVDLARFSPEGDEASDLALLAGYGIEPPYVAFAGTLEPRKDVPTLVDAFARLAGAHPDLRLVLAGGDGWGAGAVRDAVAASGVATRVVRPGYLPPEVMPALYRRAAAVAYPSLQEGFGLPPLEAIACGAPVVTTSGSSIDEVVGDAALRVPPSDAFALARALEHVLGDEETARRLRAAGPARAARFTWDAAADRYLAAYEQAARRRAVA